MLSFVRSVTMDKWTEDQLRKMRTGGNASFTQFCESYDPSAGGYPGPEDRQKIVNNAEGMNGGGGLSAGGASAGAEKGRVMKMKYGSWAVAQYREKVRLRRFWCYLTSLSHVCIVSSQRKRQSLPQNGPPRPRPQRSQTF